MNQLKTLPINNLRKKPVRTAILSTLIFFLSFFLFGGTVILSGLHNGLTSLENRLGADIILVPKSVAQKEDLDDILLQGTTGYFYMSQDILDQAAGTEGVDIASPQIFLASLRADCCTAAIQVIGIDQDTDFTIQPWISSRFSENLNDYEVVAGSKIGTVVGGTIKIYNRECKVVAKLEETGTGVDTAVYTTMDTVKLLMEAAMELGHDLDISGDPDTEISAVYIKVADGYSVEEVANNLKVHVRKAAVIQTKNMLTGVADSLAGISAMAKIILLVLWVLGFGLLFVSFALLINERKREFSVLRMLGATKGMIISIIMKETSLLSIAGSILGVLLSSVLIFSFHTAIENKLNLPFLLPGLSGCLGLMLLTLVMTIVSAGIAACYCAIRLSRVEPGIILS